MAGSTITRQLGGLKTPRRGKAIPLKLKKRGKLVSKAGKGKAPVKASGGSGGGGINSPLTEINNSRTYYETVREWRSADGLFIIQHRNIKKLSMKDATGAQIQFIYSDVDINKPL